MAFKLSKTQASEFEDLLAKVEEMRGNADTAVSEYNAAIEELRAPVEKAVEDFNSAMSDLRQFVSDFTGDMHSEYDEKSERWQEGDRGQSVASWIQEWEIAGDSLDDVSAEFPDEIEIDLPDFDEQPYEAES